MIVPPTEATTIPVVVGRAARRWPDHDFVVSPDRRITFADADALSRRLAHRLIDAGVGKGTRVAFWYPNGVEWVVVWLAITRLGGVALPLSTAYTATELRGALRHGDAALLLARGWAGISVTDLLERAVPGLAESDGAVPLRLPAVPALRSVWVDDTALPTRGVPAWGTPVAPLAQPERSEHDDELLDALEAEVSPADWMIVIHTSGTTSEPKGVVHTHGSAVRHGANLARFNEMDPLGRNFCSMPFFWVGGVGVNLTTALAIGSTVLCTETWDPDAALDLMERERATHIWMWGHHLRRLADFVRASGRDVSGIPFFARMAAASATDPGLRHNSLGMTETWGPHTAGGPERERVLPEELRGSFGLAIPGVEHRIVDPVTGAVLPDGAEGEICVRGYSLMDGMLKRERHDVFDDDGWFHTGDRGCFVDGYLIFRGRSGGMIKTAGANVAPREVEEVLERHPDVVMAFAVGVPDEDRGEVVAVAVVPRAGAQTTVDELRSYVGDTVSAYKVPRRWLVVDEDTVPMLPSGKPDVRALTARLSQ